MPKYIENILHKTQHNMVPLTYTPHKWTPSKYDNVTQYANLPDDSPPLEKKLQNMYNLF